MRGRSARAKTSRLLECGVRPRGSGGTETDPTHGRPDGKLHVKASEKLVAAGVSQSSSEYGKRPRCPVVPSRCAHGWLTAVSACAAAVRPGLGRTVSRHVQKRRYIRGGDQDRGARRRERAVVQPGFEQHRLRCVTSTDCRRGCQFRVCLDASECTQRGAMIVMTILCSIARLPVPSRPLRWQAASRPLPGRCRLAAHRGGSPGRAAGWGSPLTTPCHGGTGLRVDIRWRRRRCHRRTELKWLADARLVTLCVGC